MTANGWFQILFFFALVLVSAKPIGVYMARVFEREHTFADILFRPIERVDLSDSPASTSRMRCDGRSIPRRCFYSAW